MPRQNYGNAIWNGVEWAEDFTIECWIKFSGLNDSLTIFGKDYLNLPEDQRIITSSTTQMNGVRNHLSYNIVLIVELYLILDIQTVLQHQMQILIKTQEY